MAPRLPDTIDEKLFGLYLSDHLTGATAGLARIDRMSDDFTDTPVHAELARIGSEIRGERSLLRALIHDLGLRQRPYRQAASWLLERVGRLKLNGRIFNRSPLTLVLEAELMRSAIMGKFGLWQTLEDRAAEIGLDPARFADLARQAQDQLAALERVHAYARATGFRAQDNARS
ncbi:hypothetical protein [Arthrobacter sp. 92]|jgi:hypothetical protein|uniref:hypothetical protein n=1 Tax=Arthrobacter sp. 92 TaxID=3418175 RepID=UPI003D0172B5